MKRTKILAALSAAAMAVSMAAVPAQAAAASDSTSSAVVMGAVSYDIIDVVNAFKDAGFNSLNVNNLRNFLILNDDYFSDSDYADFIDFANDIKDLYFAPLAYSLFYKTPAQLSESERYDVLDNLTAAEKDAIDKRLIKVAEDHYVLVTFDYDANGYTVVYGSMRQGASKKSKSSGSGYSFDDDDEDWGYSKSSKSGSISKASVSLSATKLIYNGSARKPAVAVKLNGKKLVKGRDYTLTFKNNIRPGQATVTITGKGSYSGSKTVAYYIAPRTLTLRKLSSPAKYKIKAVWNREPVATGYNIQVSANSGFGSVKNYYVKNNNTVTKTISGLTSGRRYFVRVRAYKQISTRKICGKFSAVKKITVK